MQELVKQDTAPREIYEEAQIRIEKSAFESNKLKLHQTSSKRKRRLMVQRMQPISL